ncbi:MAG: DUF5937 family protein [Micromonosporaceae bacterium]
MLRLTFTAADVASTRFAYSPLWEVVASVRALRQPGAHALHLPWLRWARRRLAGAELAPLYDLVPAGTRTTPGFLTPAPSTVEPELAAELAALRRTPSDLVRDSLDRMPWRRSPTVEALYADPRAGLPRLVAAIETYWELALAPHWARLRALLEGDVLYRTRRLAEGGAAALFNDLHPGIAWDGDELRVAHTDVRRAATLTGTGLVLVPSAYVWPKVYSKTVQPWQPVLRYPARGVATLWESGGAASPAAVAAVLGRSRALLLAELDAPASTTELARRTGITPGGVSQHLTALRDAGLVTGHRDRRSVLYARTAVADALLAAAAP